MHPAREGSGLRQGHVIYRSCVVASPSKVVSRVAVTLFLWLPGTLFCAEFACAPGATVSAPAVTEEDFEVLAEVTVSGAKPVTRAKDLSSWLKRLEGQYEIEGYVDLCGDGRSADLRIATGKADCASLFERQVPMSHGLYCQVDVRWPLAQGRNGMPVSGGESHLSPAVVVYGLAPDLPGIQFMQIDNQGLAAHAKGEVVGDTLTTRESCDLADSCRKVTRLAARADSPSIVMLVDYEVNARRVLRQAFLLHRVTDIKITRSGSEFLMQEDLLRVGER